MAALASVVSGISTKPKPRERPVSRSMMIWTRSTIPYDAKIWLSSASVVVKARFPTKIFMDHSLEKDQTSLCRIEA